MSLGSSLFQLLWQRKGSSAAGEAPKDKPRGPAGPGVRIKPPAVVAVQFESLIGHDDREKVTTFRDKPWCAICHLQCSFDNGLFTGTGWLISPTTVITAAHNLWNAPPASGESPRGTGRVNSILVTPGKPDGLAKGPFGSQTVDGSLQTAYDKRWRSETGNRRLYYDYGAIFLKAPGFANLPFYFQPFAQPVQGWSDLNLNCAGYPQDRGVFTMATGKACSVQPGGSCFVGPNSEMVAHDIDTGGGESGGPIFWCSEDRESYFVLAVHTQGKGLVPQFNAGVRINDEMIAVFSGWNSRPGDFRDGIAVGVA